MVGMVRVCGDAAAGEEELPRLAPCVRRALAEAGLLTEAVGVSKEIDLVESRLWINLQCGREPAAAAWVNSRKAGVNHPSGLKV